ncbi:MAG: YihY/virulence factor BrkB family protein, partial [Cyclobacteriaceae bacterium]|nr:YihY/virulence factor BrkB family protein [Cyclobacteriaceae bacterium]
RIFPMKNRITRYVLNSSLAVLIVRLLISIRFKNYENVSLFEVIKVFFEKITKDDIIQRANGVSFNFTLAIFPAILFLFTLIPFIHNFIPEVDSENILLFIGQFMPESMFSVISSTIEDILNQSRGGLLTFGALFSLFLAANGVLSLMQAFNACYKTVEKRGFFKTRLVSIALTVMLAFALILAIVLLVIGGFIIDTISSIEWVNIDSYMVSLIMVVRFLVLFLVFYFAISCIYYFGPAVHYNWRFFSLGSIISTLLCIASSYGFSYYISNFATYNKLYGSIGVMIAFMLWQFILTVILLVGYELNASIHQAHRIIGEEQL